MFVMMVAIKLNKPINKSQIQQVKPLCKSFSVTIYNPMYEQTVQICFSVQICAFSQNPQQTNQI